MSGVSSAKTSRAPTTSLKEFDALCVELREKRRIVARRRIAQFFSQLLKRGIGAHDAGDAVAVGDANAAMAEQQRRQRHV